MATETVSEVMTRFDALRKEMSIRHRSEIAEVNAVFARALDAARFNERIKATTKG